MPPPSHPLNGTHTLGHILAACAQAISQHAQITARHSEALGRVEAKQDMILSAVSTKKAGSSLAETLSALYTLLEIVIKVWGPLTALAVAAYKLGWPLLRHVLGFG